MVLFWFAGDGNAGDIYHTGKIDQNSTFLKFWKINAVSTKKFENYVQKKKNAFQQR